MGISPLASGSLPVTARPVTFQIVFIDFDDNNVMNRSNLGIFVTLTGVLIVVAALSQAISHALGASQTALLTSVCAVEVVLFVVLIRMARTTRTGS